MLVVELHREGLRDYQIVPYEVTADSIKKAEPYWLLLRLDRQFV